MTTTRLGRALRHGRDRAMRRMEHGLVVASSAVLVRAGAPVAPPAGVADPGSDTLGPPEAVLPADGATADGATTDGATADGATTGGTTSAGEFEFMDDAASYELIFFLIAAGLTLLLGAVFVLVLVVGNRREVAALESAEATDAPAENEPAPSAADSARE